MVRRIQVLVSVLGLSLAALVAGTGGASATGPAAFQVFDEPTAQYKGSSCDVDLSAIPRDTQVQTIHGCGTTVRFLRPLVKLSLGQGWRDWGHPPFTESADVSLDVLKQFKDHGIRMSFRRAVTTGGFEIQPLNPFRTVTFAVSFYSGPDGRGRLVGSIVRQVSGDHGARLIGATSSQGWRSIVVSQSPGRPKFAIAHLRL